MSKSKYGLEMLFVFSVSAIVKFEYIYIFFFFFFSFTFFNNISSILYIMNTK